MVGDVTSIAYDEFGMLAENAAESGLDFDPDTPPRVHRTFVEGPSGHQVSAIVWGDAPAQLVLLHGGAQNAHTWDTVALAMGRPLVAIDLPGHGHSDWRGDKAYRPQDMAGDVVAAIGALAPDATTLVGMSLGGLTALAVLATAPDLVRRLALVDVTPGVNQQKAEPIISFVSGPERFESFDEILERTMAFNPSRSRSSLRRGVLHNARELPDGSWEWRYDLHTPDQLGVSSAGVDAFTEHVVDLWDAVSALTCDLLLVQGGMSGVVDDEDVAELQRRRPDAGVVVVEEAGHSVQGDRPVELAGLIADFHDRT